MKTLTKERPILFSGSMVRAIRDGRKTQTRRVCKPPKPFESTDFGLNVQCPYGKSGDRLWVRETWAKDMNDFVYRSDNCWENKIIQWKPSIHMPRKASRITLKVVDTRLERLQDISETDAIAEGVDQSTCPIMAIGNSASSVDWVAGFQNLWDSINADRGYSWDSNPWVWVVSFTTI